jgi:hypothetical protein
VLIREDGAMPPAMPTVESSRSPIDVNP